MATDVKKMEDIRALLAKLNAQTDRNPSVPKGCFTTQMVADAEEVGADSAIRMVRLWVHAGVIEFAGKAKVQTICKEYTRVPIYRATEKK
jgi:hypothetical protein